MVRSSNPKIIFKDIKRSLGRAMDQLFEDINRDIRDTTPVLTGRAQRGWRYTPRYKIGYQGALIHNNVEYITSLDRGSSRQAPNGMVKPAIDKNIRRKRKI